jgi:phage-related minor tail protein
LDKSEIGKRVMASTGRGSRATAEGPPTQFASTTPPQTPMMDHSFTLQAIMDLKGAVSSLVAKVDRLIQDVGKQDSKIDTVRHQISFVRGAIWVIGGLLAVALAAAAIYVRLKGTF